MPRDFEKNPYSADEARVARFWFDKGIGGGDDPIGSLIASHEMLVAQRNALAKRLGVDPVSVTGEAMDALGKDPA